jgi:hypothetical protein
MLKLAISMTSILTFALMAPGSCQQKNRAPESQGPVLTLEAPTRVSFGQSVVLKLKVKNTGQKALDLYLSGRPAYDFVVMGADGTEIWEWLHGQPVQLILEIKKLHPGQELEFRAEWNQHDNTGRPVAAGTYLLKGILNLELQKLETEPRTLEISPP